MTLTCGWLRAAGPRRAKLVDHLQDSRQRLQFYSLQFDTRAHTPEVFAARGIVALAPP